MPLAWTVAVYVLTPGVMQVGASVTSDVIVALYVSLWSTSFKQVNVTVADDILQ